MEEISIMSGGIRLVSANCAAVIGSKKRTKEIGARGGTGLSAVWNEK